MAATPRNSTSTRSTPTMSCSIRHRMFHSVTLLLISLISLLRGPRCLGFMTLVRQRHHPFDVCSSMYMPTPSTSAVWMSSTKNPVRKDKKKGNKKGGKKHQRRAVPRRKAIHKYVDRSQQPPPRLLSNNDNSDTIADRYTDSTIATSCPHFDDCSGCTMGTRLAETPVVAAAERYFASERYDGTQQQNVDAATAFPVTIPTPLTHWRTQAKLVAANKSSSSWLPEGCVFGLYRRKSHTVVPIPDCVVHHPAITSALTRLEQATREARITACENREGELRYVQMQVERSTHKICLTLVWNAASLKECQPGLSRLVKALQQHDVWHSIWCHCNNGGGNAIFSRHANAWHRLAGPEYMREPILVAAAQDQDESVGWLYFSPRTFRQGNLDGFEQLALDVAKAVPPQSRVCELYAGVGVLGLTALAWHHQQQGQPSLQWLRCSDENPANPWAFDHAVHSLPPEMTGRGGNAATQEKELTLGEIARMAEAGNSVYSSNSDDKTSYMVASAYAALQAGQALGANVLIVDPPRKGLEPEVVDELCKPFQRNQPYVEDATILALSDDQVNWVNDVQTLIYVSCGFDALARDCDRLLSSRGAGWKLVRSEGYILFPGSDHVETLAIFERE